MRFFPFLDFVIARPIVGIQLTGNKRDNNVEMGIVLIG